MTDQHSLTADDAPTASGMPMLGLGTWENTDPEDCRTAVATALETGYRHVDTAQIYGNEAEVGDGIARADVDREEVFLATKVWIDNLAPEDVRATTEASLDRLGVDAVDLMYVHWPAREYDPEATLAAFDELYDDGLVDRIGISNFEPRQVADAVDRTDAPVFANQVECHPLLQQDGLREYAREDGHHLVAYSPIARNRVADEPVLQEIAEKHDASPAQVSLAWLLSREAVAPIPKAASREHVAGNWAARDLELDAADLDRIEGLDRGERVVDFDAAPWNRV